MNKSDIQGEIIKYAYDLTEKELLVLILSLRLVDLPEESLLLLLAGAKSIIEKRKKG